MLENIHVEITDVGDEEMRQITISHNGQTVSHRMPWPFLALSNNDPYAQRFMLGSICWANRIHPQGQWADDFERLGIDTELLHDELMEVPSGPEADRL